MGCDYQLFIRRYVFVENVHKINDITNFFPKNAYWARYLQKSNL